MACSEISKRGKFIVYERQPEAEFKAGCTSTLTVKKSRRNFAFAAWLLATRDGLAVTLC
jgi:hypothetical protein